MKLEMDWLRANCTKLHYFGLGFIQLKLDKEHRLHFYTMRLPAVIGREEIHNHRYDFHSQILKGYLKQDLFQTVQGNTHTVEDESCQEGVKPEGHFPSLCGVLLTSSHMYYEGSEYWVDHNTFHRVESNFGITHLTRGDYKKEFAKVMRLAGADKVCPFGVKVEEKNLWEIIEEMIKA
jgi:hypothetical protein